MIASSENDAKIEAQIQQVAQRLREERRKANVSQMELSFMAGLSQNQVNCIETGKRNPNLYTVLKICSALQITPEILFKANTTEERKTARETVIDLVTKYM
jgi:transcriptional regulator with XRE-family HTH domain